MEKWQAVIIAVVLLVVIVFLPPIVALLLVSLSSLWASLDAGKIKAKNYQSKFLTASPANVFIGSLLLWIVVFPWYLYYRSQIQSWLVDLRTATDAPTGIVDIAEENDTLNH